MKDKIYRYIAVGLVILVAAVLRVNTFYLPHNHGDQVHYLCLAMKLDSSGLKDYNLKGVDCVRNMETLKVVPSLDKEKGQVLRWLEEHNVFYYSNEPVTNMPPAFSYALMLSHRAFSPGLPYMSVEEDFGAEAIMVRPKAFFDTQFYAVWINFALSLMLILLTFALGNALFDEKAGLWASILLAVSPVDLLTSQRLWADEMTAFFAIVSLLLLFYAKKKSNIFLLAAAGISAGLCALSKATGLFVIAIAVVYLAGRTFLPGRNVPPGRNVLRDIIIFCAASLIVCGFWYMKIGHTYGTPFYAPHQPGIEKLTWWFNMLSQRSRLGQLYYFAWLSPLFVLTYLSLARFITRKEFSEGNLLLLSWFIIFSILLIAANGREERYLLPAYPAIAVLSGSAIESMRADLNAARRGIGNIAIILAFAVSCAWSLQLAFQCVFSNGLIYNVF